MISPSLKFPTARWRGEFLSSERCLPEEIPVAMTYGRESFAVMMASPCDLVDFARGFSLSEGIVSALEEISALEVIFLENGAECRMELTPARRDALAARRRRIAGPAGCGLCGMDSLAEAIKPPKRVATDLVLTPAAVMAAMARLGPLQVLNELTRGVHAAAFYTPADEALLVREDVGRHNALDKVIGAAAAAGRAGAAGVLLLTSRVSIELIQKAAVFGAGIVVAVSVPSARAVRDADQAGIALVGIARADGFEVFTHPARIAGAL